jgi:protein TonB
MSNRCQCWTAAGLTLALGVAVVAAAGPTPAASVEAAPKPSEGSAPAGDVNIPVQRVPAPAERKPPTDGRKLTFEEAMYVPPKFRSRVRPVYPFELLRAGVTGRARVACLIDGNGDVVRTDVIEASRPEFGAALAAAVEASKFATATNEGEPISTILGFSHTFSPEDKTAPDLRQEVAMLERESRRPRSITKAAQLDTLPRPSERVSPVYPPALLAQRQSGETVVEFLLDEQGVPRVPRVVATTQPGFGYAAVQAIVRWRFEPAVARGAPTAVRVIVPFRFEGG